MAGEPEQAREASHRHLAFIEEILLDRSREQSRRERSLRRLQQRKGRELRFLSAIFRARQLNAEPVLLNFWLFKGEERRVQWDRFQINQRLDR